MVCVFAVFATLSMPFFKQFGVGLAAAILIDATIVRAVLLPATMKLLGDWNWYLPRWLEWLPRVGERQAGADRRAGASAGAGAHHPCGAQAEAPPRLRPHHGPDPDRDRRARARVREGHIRRGHRFSCPAGASSRPADPASVLLRHGAGQLRRGLRHPRRPENRAKPGSRLIALRVIRIKALSAHPGAPVFRLQGGPGVTNMTFPDASRLADNHDVVLVGYRGIDSSVRLDCPEVSSALKRSTDFLGQKSYRAYSRAFRNCKLAGYTLPEQADDLEAARRALRSATIDLVSESAGTRLAMIYAWRHPRSVNRSMMIGVNPPGHFLWSPKVTDQLIGRYSRLCAQDAGCSRQTDDLAASMRKTAAHMPHRFWGLPIPTGDAKIASFFGLMESTSASEPLSAPMTIGSWISAADGDFEWALVPVADGADGAPRGLRLGRRAAAVGRADTRAADRYFAQGPHPQRLDSRQPGHRVRLRRRRIHARVPTGAGLQRVRPGSRLRRPDAPR